MICAAAGVTMAFLFDDSCQQDGGQHFLFARWAWTHPELFVGVWSRPLYTSLYAFPALIGYRAARLFTVLICLLIAHQTWRLAEDLKLNRAPLAVALVWLQPSFFLFCADNMTEPVFALVYVIAMRLHHRGWVKAGMIVASLMILARPEGFFLGLLWAAFAFVVPPSGGKGLFIETFRLKAGLQTPLLATGAFVWWLAAWLITGDPLFIKHNWPANWPMTGTIYGAAGLYAYPIRLPEIVGLFLLPPFFYGLFHLLNRRKFHTITSTFILFFVLHTILRAYGLLGSAGYPRYLVAISPAIALITLVGWNEMSKLFAGASRFFRTASAAIVIAISAYTNFVYADGAEWTRDARAIAAVHSWFQSQTDKPEIQRLVWCQPYAGILFDRDPWENSGFTRDREADLKTLREMPAGTMVVWDERVGPKWFGLQAKDFEEAGFVRLHTQAFTLKGYILDRSWFGYGGPRAQTIYLLYKPREEK
ncbi:MAG: hypothetical protein ACREBD_30100 [Blastocatellia bacterium]